VKSLSDAISVHAPIQFEYRILLEGETRYIRCEALLPSSSRVSDTASLAAWCWMFASPG
jgi:hypothetical protein